ncbi:MAG: hypothetical protein QM758_26185 [Armatimonas sp.]
MTSYSYSSGWCERCGRRRGGDGRCTNCDPWWTSALVQVGAPLMAACAALLVFLIATFGTRPTPLPERASARGGGSSGKSLLGAPMVPGFPSSALNTGFPSAPAPSYVASTPAFSSTSMSGGTGWQSSPIVPAVNPDAARWAELEELRSMVWAADAMERNLPSAQGPSGTVVAASNLEAISN